MIKNNVSFLINNNTHSKNLKEFFILNKHKNCIIKFENDLKFNQELINEIVKLKAIHKKTIVLISKNLTLKDFKNVVPTMQEAIDIIEIEEIERSLNF